MSLCTLLASPEYTIEDLGPISENNGRACAVNDLSWIVGSIGNGGNGSAFIWKNEAFREIGAVGGGLGATSINNDGIVVGHSDSGGTIAGAFVWENDQMNALEMLPGAQWSYAHGINKDGIIVGKCNLTEGTLSYYHAVQWENGFISDLGVLENVSQYRHSSQANAINDKGVAVGFSFGTPDGYDWGVYAVSWENGIIKNLDTLGIGSQARDINNAGQIVGSISYRSDEENRTAYTHAGLWEDGAVIDLGTLGNGRRSNALAINESGQIVGKSTMTDSMADLNYHAVLWNNGELFDLNEQIDLTAGWKLEEAVDINDKGQIIGSGILDGVRHAYLLNRKGCNDVPSKIVLTSPPGKTGDAHPSFTWEEDTCATWYKFFLKDTSRHFKYVQWYEIDDNDPDFPEAACSNGECSITLESALDEGNYEWWVRGWNENGNGEWSDGMENKPPLQPFLVGISISPAGFHTFTWIKNYHTTWYHFYLQNISSDFKFATWYEIDDNDPDFPEVTCTENDCSISLDDKLENDAYIFWVRGWNEYGKGEWSVGETFTVPE